MPTAYPQAQERTLDQFREVPTSPYVKNFTEERKKRLIRVLMREGDVRLLKFNQSLCPHCVEEKKFDKMKVDSVVYTKDGKVYILKLCPEHGTTKEVYWEDFEMYKKAEKFQDPGVTLENPEIKKSLSNINCPLDCGLCAEHESHTNLGNVVLTNRCDLSCWYCFFYAKEGEPIYEPSLGRLREMFHRLRNQKPVPCNALQLTGGEPTLRDDLIEIIKLAKEEGFDHIQLNTNGIRLSKNPELAKKLREAGCHVLYLSFDGVTPKTNPKNYWEIPQAIENCRQANLRLVLVPTVIGGVNDHELGDIVRFAFGNNDVVRGVNFQPVSLVGRMPDKMRAKQRITIPGTVKRIEEQTDGQIGKEDFYPVPCVKAITDFVEAIKGGRKYRMSAHFACGAATYVFRDGAKMVPLPRFFDVEGFFEYVDGLAKELNESTFKLFKKPAAISKILLNIRKFVDKEKVPKNLKFSKLLAKALLSGSYRGLGEFHHHSLFIGMMHFQDPYNWDIDRIHKCVIHYAMPDGRIVPFCTFNVIPELYRDDVQRKFSVQPEKWEKQTGKKLSDDKYKRRFTEEEKRKIDEFYDKFKKDNFEKTMKEIDDREKTKEKDDVYTQKKTKTTDIIEEMAKEIEPEKRTTEKITKNMSIGDVIGNYPETIPILLEHGVHCIGCQVAAWETLEQGLKGHGINEKQIEEIIKKMNKVVSKRVETKKPKIVTKEKSTTKKKTKTQTKKRSTTKKTKKTTKTTKKRKKKR
jgi:hypothetical protein